MGVYHGQITLHTHGNCHMIDVTESVQTHIEKSGLSTGICTVFCAGSTASITTIEYEEGLLKDFPEAMERIAPIDVPYEHHLRWGDGNGHSHIRASVVGPSLTVPFVNRRLTLGTWQQITLVDFDIMPRQRILDVLIVGE